MFSLSIASSSSLQCAITNQGVRHAYQCELNIDQELQKESRERGAIKTNNQLSMEHGGTGACFTTTHHPVKQN
jgi:hypothetical protein